MAGVNKSKKAHVVFDSRSDNKHPVLTVSKQLDLVTLYDEE